MTRPKVEYFDLAGECRCSLREDGTPKGLAAYSAVPGWKGATVTFQIARAILKRQREIDLMERWLAAWSHK